MTNLSLPPNTRTKIQGCPEKEAWADRLGVQNKRKQGKDQTSTISSTCHFFSDQNVKKLRSKKKSKDSTTRKHRQHQTPL